MNLKDLTIRDATITDMKKLLVLEQEVISAERPYNSSLKDFGAHYYDMESLILDKKTRLLVGEMYGEIIATGYVQLRVSKPALEHEKHGYMGFMYVAESFRGLGINRIIIGDLVEWGKDRGVRDFYLDVYQANGSAVRAYEKSGFKGSLLEMKLGLD